MVEIENDLKNVLVVPRDVVSKPRSESFKKSVVDAKVEYRSRSLIDWLETFVPMVKWLRIYNFKANIMADIVAGLTVTAVIIPQSMSFAKLAGLPVQFGLYSSFVPIYAYSVFGSSRQLAIGTSAVSSLTFNSVMNAMNPNSKGLFLYSLDYLSPRSFITLVSPFPCYNPFFRFQHD
jgi:sulfate transporter 4